MQLGLMTNPNPSDPSSGLLGEIAWASQNGLDYVDILLEAPTAALESTDWNAVAKILDDTGMTAVCQAASYLPLDNPSPPVRQAALDELRRSVDAAQIIGAPLLTVTFAGWPSHFPEKVGYEFTAQMMGILVKHGQERMVDVSLENSPRNQHQLKYFREIFHQLPDLKLTYDIGHGNIGTAAQHTSRDYLFALSTHLAHVHLSDNDGREPSRLPLGAPTAGGIDLSRDLQTLQSFGYSGRITLEIYGDRRWLLVSADLVRELWRTSGSET